MSIQQVSVIGAGTMGNGIAHTFARYGFDVNLIDVSRDQLDKANATIARNTDRQLAKEQIDADTAARIKTSIRTSTELAAVSDSQVVIEAATENAELKLSIFRQLDQLAPAGCILASNTSSIPITRIAAVTGRPSQVIGMHFMNPVPLMKLVEIINGYSTDPGVTAAIVELSKRLDKIPCVVNDYPGFIANRILMPMINEAVYSLYEGVAGVESIDTIMKLGMAHPMGPLQLADFIGLDVCVSILQVLHDGFGNPKYAPCPLLLNMVSAGRLGIKSGEGFYQYTPGSRSLVVSNRFN